VVNAERIVEDDRIGLGYILKALTLDQANRGLDDRFCGKPVGLLSQRFGYPNRK
jgi:hypothetical protein